MIPLLGALTLSENLKGNLVKFGANEGGVGKCQVLTGILNLFIISFWYDPTPSKK